MSPNKRDRKKGLVENTRYTEAEDAALREAWEKTEPDVNATAFWICVRRRMKSVRKARNLQRRATVLGGMRSKIIKR